MSDKEHWPGQAQLNVAAKQHHAAGRREAWGKMRQNCRWFSTRAGRCRLQLPAPKLCTYDTCPLLQDGEK